jgi:signal transduction histidine kinase
MSQLLLIFATGILLVLLFLLFRTSAHRNALKRHLSRMEDEKRELRGQTERINREFRGNDRTPELSCHASSELIRQMAHDLRNPLNNIIGFADVLLAEMEGALTDPQKKDVQIIFDNAREMMDQINDFQEMAAIQAGTIQLRRKLLPLQPAVAEALLPWHNGIPGRKVVIKHEVPPDLPPVYVDPRRLQQILTSLIRNTLRFLRKGEIVFQARWSSREGVPFAPPPELKERYHCIRMTVHIAEPGLDQLDAFFRSHLGEKSSASQSGRGGGLSLSVSQELVHLHNGKIGTEKESDQTYVLWFTLPVVHVQP